MSNPFDSPLFDDFFGNQIQSQPCLPPTSDNNINNSASSVQYNDLDFDDFLSAALDPAHQNSANQTSSTTFGNVASTGTPTNFNLFHLPHLNGNAGQNKVDQRYLADVEPNLAGSRDTFYNDDESLQPMDESDVIKEAMQEEYEEEMMDGSDRDEETSEEGTQRGFVWTDEWNDRLKRLIDGGVSQENLTNSSRSVKWQKIADNFNECLEHGQPALKREQIYQHFYHLREFNSKCTTAEKEVVQALLELDKPDDFIRPYLENGFRDAVSLEKVLVTAKEDKFNEPRPGTEEEDERRLKFRRKIVSYVSEELGKEHSSSKEIIRQVRIWVSNDPKVKRKMHTVQPIGRPRKEPTLTETTTELAHLLRPFRKTYKWRHRVTYHPGDVRKLALNYFALHRLLGAPFEIDMMLAWLKRAEALDCQVLPPVDQHDQRQDQSEGATALAHQMVSPTKCLLSLMEKRKNVFGAYDSDAFNYYNCPDYPPAESLLPPTLHTVAGIRGLLLHRKNLENSSDVGDEATMAGCCTAGNAQSDDKMMRRMLSLFYWPMRLCAKILDENMEAGRNSDGDSDSDEDRCWQLDSLTWPDSVKFGFM